MSENQQHLVSLLYSVHDKLRLKKSQTKDDQEWQEAWREHTSDFKTLQEYSKAMHELATKIWEPRNAVNPDHDHHHDSQHNLAISKDPKSKSVKLKCRLEWVVRCCTEYFKDEFQAGRKKLNLLDVGSCYNPFSKYSEHFDIVAVDLCPAPGFEDCIFQCDFLEVGLMEKGETDTCIEAVMGAAISREPGKYNVIKHLPQSSFDVVVFSYFLEYLADAKQRVGSCRKAYQLLGENGLLFILRPDSSRVTPGGNNVLIKKMKVGMVVLGFKRIYFEKLEHLWCMAFKKLNEEERAILMQSLYFRKDVEKIGIDFSLEDSERIHELFGISQDFKQRPETETSHIYKHDASESHCDQLLLEELPNFDLEVSKKMLLVKESKNDYLVCMHFIRWRTNGEKMNGHFGTVHYANRH